MKQENFFAPGAIQEIDTLLSRFPSRRVFLVTGARSFTMSGAEQKLRPFLVGREVERFSVLGSLPTLEELTRGLQVYRTGNFDLILAIGGGTVLDIAKLIAIFSAQSQPVSVLIQRPNMLTDRSIPLVAVPTTAGSGAEATHFAVLYLDKTKYSIAHPSILPDISIVDPDLTISLPARSAAVSGLDALSQAIESYWSNNATPGSKGYAQQAITLAYNALVPSIMNRDPKACIDLSHASLLAGQAINISKTTAPHALSYTLTAHFNIPHGLAVFLTLGEFLAHIANAKNDEICHPRGPSYVRQTIREICLMLGSSDSASVRSNLTTRATSIGLETRLSSFGITKNDFNMIVDNINLERLSNHPCRITNDVLFIILERIA